VSKSRLTCGDFGGVNAQGQPCRVAAADGPCRTHREQVAAQSEIARLVDVTHQFRTDPFSRKSDKVCIVGFTDHREAALHAPYNDGTWERWGLNELYRYMPVDQFDRWFEIHDREYLEQTDDGKQHMQDLATFDIPVFMQRRHDDIPASMEFPVEWLCQTLDSRYWTNCPAYMIGMAIAMGYSTIHVVGVDMAQDTEYHTQRPCCEHWLGFAKGRGLEIAVPEQSDLLSTLGLYGYQSKETAFSGKIEARIAWLHTRDNELLAGIRHLDAQYNQQHDNLKAQELRHEGAIHELMQARQSAKRDERIDALKASLGELRTKLGQMSAEYRDKSTKLAAERNQVVGAITNSEYLLRSWMVKADGMRPGIPNRADDPATGITPGTDTKPLPTVPSVAAG